MTRESLLMALDYRGILDSVTGAATTSLFHQSMLRTARPQDLVTGILFVGMAPGPPDESSLRAQARDAVRQGKLPARRPDRMWGGPGVGAPCTICELAVTGNELEFEVEFDTPGGLEQFHVHVRCFAAWEVEWARTE
jgi:hypothetical protein